MIHDARKLPKQHQLKCDICIVGAGAAGIVLALELAKTGRNIVLLEAGGMHRSGRSQDLYRGHLANPYNHLPPDSDRYRQFGGTTSIWGGRCIPFDNIDFEPRDYVPHSGWPFTRKDLDRHYRKAHYYCECGSFVYNSIKVFAHKPKKMVSGFVDDKIITTSLERWSPPTNFGKVYRDSLNQALNVHVFLHAICVNLVVSADGRKVSKLEALTFRKNKISILPQICILSGGGLEVTRLLLTSDQIHRSGIGNHSNWLGRGYMCHINGVIARLKFRDDVKVISGYERDQDGIYCRRRFLISEKAQRKYGILNTHLLLDRPLMQDASHKSGMLSLAYLTKLIGQKSIKYLPVKGKYSLYWRHCQNIIKGSPEILTILPKWFRNRFLQQRRIPSLLLKPKNNTYHLYYHTEQIPYKDSQVKLSDDRDIFGIRRLYIDYRISDIDVESIYRAHKLLDSELRKNGVGHIIFLSNNPKAQILKHQATLGHHIGTTRMSSDPSMGVVDENSRVHNLSNLYIASSSVFPTCSQANPTLTIVAMAIRLAKFLKDTKL